jgi:hypothetical protein
MTLTGGCLCRSVTYEISGDPLTTVICHCEHCQRQSGAAYSVNVVVLESQMSVTGELAVFEDRGESGDAVYVLRKFCGSCGSPILSELIEPAGIYAVKAGTLDDKTGVAPAAQVFTDHKQIWVDLDLPAKGRQ